MKHRIIIPALIGLAACGPLPSDYAGKVVGFNGHMVEIEGVWDGTASFQPTEAMLDAARALCAPRSARFISAGGKDHGSRVISSPYGTSYVSGSDAWPMTIFRFACVNP